MMQKNKSPNANAIKLPDKVIPEADRATLGRMFDSMENDVELHLYAEDGPEDVLVLFNLQLANELSECSSKIKPVRHTEAESKALPGLPQRPLLTVKAVDADHPVLHLIGAPLGREAKSLVKAIMLAGNNDSELSAAAREHVVQLKEKRDIKVFGAGT